MITIIKNIFTAMGRPFNSLLLIGAVISIFFGLVIPTGKVLVGLGVIQFVMPVSLVFCVNAGILLSGLMLLRFVLQLKTGMFTLLTAAILAALMLLYRKSRKLNTVAVLTGAAGYLLIYASLIILSVQKGGALPVILYAAAILLFAMLCAIGIKANLKDPKIHWVIETSNVLCQLLVAIATVLLFT
ncbi:MAG: hypothetical protein IIU01_02480 [Oscillospiraceae bacterium]|nr:hypothetical protein [Oscillospiraceae bacterium]